MLLGLRITVTVTWLRYGLFEAGCHPIYVGQCSPCCLGLAALVLCWKKEFTRGEAFHGLAKTASSRDDQRVQSFVFCWEGSIPSYLLTSTSDIRRAAHAGWGQQKLFIWSLRWGFLLRASRMEQALWNSFTEQGKLSHHHVFNLFVVHQLLASVQSIAAELQQTGMYRIFMFSAIAHFRCEGKKHFWRSPLP